MPGRASPSPPRSLSQRRLRSGGQHKLVRTAMALILQVAITIIFAISLRLPLKWLFAGRVTFGRGLKTAIVARACESHNNAGDMQVAGVEDDAPFEKSLPKCEDAGRKGGGVRWGRAA
jgi:hypothetical protein